jgi:hypothetical protein
MLPIILIEVTKRRKKKEKKTFFGSLILRVFDLFDDTMLSFLFSSTLPRGHFLFNVLSEVWQLFAGVRSA